VGLGNVDAEWPMKDMKRASLSSFNLNSKHTPLTARLENIVVLSIGTGAQASSIQCQSDDEALGTMHVGSFFLLVFLL
jgi:hypothetical protein